MHLDLCALQAVQAVREVSPTRLQVLVQDASGLDGNQAWLRLGQGAQAAQVLHDKLGRRMLGLDVRTEDVVHAFGMVADQAVQICSPFGARRRN
eukprot:CAMPEP_0177419454 /NCGR_PEP_ID=MMETSP0368-20130122/69725_1 /TAXON_ID=447022 ORGANISM="Scrippsiella hangoei-like, Strain SHHI-4" /NCGR_SAMPLE_ID=MMETSP0368 /ASSEMBLY_ACC=CAM_ASM_000363 /LENGTH=93 /DNA_ID=CAMNT_0018889169 /DNA_START=49 /DNA_END=327 /DNA_ORIENTATION=-